MLSKANAKYIRVSPRKTRLVAELLKGKTVEEAGFILENANKGPAVHIKKVLDSAFANANHERREKLLEKDLIISCVRIDGGPTFRRYRAATMGRASIIRHRTSHIHIELDEPLKKDKAKSGKE